MTDKSLRSLSVFVGVAVKHYKRSDGINQLWSHKYELLQCVCVCVRARARV